MARIISRHAAPPRTPDATEPLFDETVASDAPLAARMRPRSLDEFMGQPHLVGPDGALTRVVQPGHLPSMVLWGPPGSGKTTLAVVAAKELATRRGLALRYANTPQMLDELRREAADHMPAALLRQLVDVPVLVLDDLGREQLTKWAREKLYRLLDERMRAHTPDTPRITFVENSSSLPITPIL